MMDNPVKMIRFGGNYIFLQNNKIRILGIIPFFIYFFGSSQIDLRYCLVATVLRISRCTRRTWMTG